MLDVAYVTLQIREIYGTLQQFSEISDFKSRDFSKISKRAVRDFQGVADPLGVALVIASLRTGCKWGQVRKLRLL